MTSYYVFIVLLTMPTFQNISVHLKNQSAYSKVPLHNKTNNKLTLQFCDRGRTCDNTNKDERNCSRIIDFNTEDIVVASRQFQIHYWKTDICDDECDRPLLRETLVCDQLISYSFIGSIIRIKKQAQQLKSLIVKVIPQSHTITNKFN